MGISTILVNSPRCCAVPYGTREQTRFPWKEVQPGRKTAAFLRNLRVHLHGDGCPFSKTKMEREKETNYFSFSCLFSHFIITHEPSGLS